MNSMCIVLISILEGAIVLWEIIIDNLIGWFHMKAPRKHEIFFFGFLTKQVKIICYFSNKNFLKTKSRLFLTTFRIF